jgi:mitochondrial fission protein ELM1
MRYVLIVNDGRVGHLNQSIAFAKHAGLRYDIVDISPKYFGSKAASYLFDRLGVDYPRLFKKTHIPRKDYVAVVGAGSSTYYTVKSLAKRFETKAVAMMLPKGFVLKDFDVIFAPQHDNPPALPNIVSIPANFAYVEPQEVYRPYAKSIGIVIGGNNGRFTFSPKELHDVLARIRTLYPEYEIAVTTSPRTSPVLEKTVESFGFDYEVIYSRNPVNPIPDFVYHCERIFLTADSTSMVSEAVSAGYAHVEIVDFNKPLPEKFDRFVSSLEKGGYVRRFDGSKGKANRKIDFSHYAHKAKL